MSAVASPTVELNVTESAAEEHRRRNELTGLVGVDEAQIIHRERRRQLMPDPALGRNEVPCPGGRRRRLEIGDLTSDHAC